MGKKTSPQSPKVSALLKVVGENIRLARRRRKLSSAMLAERAGMTRPTLAAIERGEPTASLGAYANVLFSLGLESDLSLIAKDDEFGRRLQDASLLRPHKSSAPQKRLK
jgi:transcriptional regulator with XRE-family HTH domain